jgi:hypothetical protein
MRPYYVGYGVQGLELLVWRIKLPTFFRTVFILRCAACAQSAMTSNTV